MVVVSILEIEIVVGKVGRIELVLDLVLLLMYENMI